MKAIRATAADLRRYRKTTQVHWTSQEEQSGDNDAAKGEGRPSAAPLPARPRLDEAALRGWLVEQVAKAAQLEIAEIDVDDSFTAYGIDSLAALTIAGELAEIVERRLPQTLLWDYPTIARLAKYLVESPAPHARAPAPGNDALQTGTQYRLLSANERGLWFLQQLAPESAAHHMVSAGRIRGTLAGDRLCDSWRRVMERHESLRTCYVAVDRQPARQVHDRVPVDFVYEDATGWDEPSLQRRLGEEGSRPFDLTRPPLLRARLYRRGPEEHILLIVAHHIVVDFWSMVVLMHELGEIYGAELAGRAADLAPPTLQYADFAAWQAATLTGPEGERLWAYWKQRLAGELPVLALPIDRPRPLRRTYRGAAEILQLEPRLADAVCALGYETGATLYVTLLAAFQILLHRYSGQCDIVVGTPVAGRSRPELANLVGYVANLMPLRVDLSGDPTVATFLEHVRTAVREAIEHQGLPFSLLVERLQPLRDPSRAPIFQVAFVLQKDHLATKDGLAAFALGASGAATSLGPLAFESLPMNDRVPPFDLTLLAAEAGGCIGLTLQYNPDLFQDDTARRMLQHYRVLLEAMADDPDAKVSELPLVSKAEHEAMLRPLAAGVVEGGLHTRFASITAGAPQAVAMIFADRHFTYGELDRRANELARRLRSLGVGPEVRVALYLDRTPELVLAMLGVLKAGGAYVPIDIAYPQERIAFMLHDAQARVILTTAVLARAVPASAARVLPVEWDAIAEANEALADGDGCDAERLAYVIYTSGSTGAPKGVLVTHRNALRLLDAAQGSFKFGTSDVWTLFHSPAFDFSVWEIWGSLLHGGRLVIVSHAVSRSPEAFYRLLAAHGVTVLNQTPSAFQQLAVAEGKLDQPSELRLRWVVFGGEALDVQALRGWFERHGDACPQLVNMYGITETTVHVTHRPIARADLNRPAASPIGGPLSHLQLHLLDQHCAPVPAGVTGEIYVGGDGVARGYLGQAGLTAQRFVPDPYSGQPGARLYRSGDLARRRTDGEIEFLGRADQQVKIHGFRIELGEIQAVLEKHPAVAHAVASALDEAGGERRLVAYVVPRDVAQAPSVDELRRHLRVTLPDYMVPAAYVMLPSLPLTVQGKIDRQHLPVPDRTRPELEQAFVPPRTEPERILAEAWAQVLQIERVGIRDNFFALGGDSIRSVQMVSLALEWDLPVRLEQLFHYQTAEELAAAISNDPDNGGVAPRALPLSQIASADREQLGAVPLADAYPLAMLQAGMLFHSAAGSASPLYHNLSSLHLKASCSEAALRAALSELGESHPVLRTSFDLTRYSEPLQLVHPRAEIPLEIEDWRDLGPAQAEQRLTRMLEEQKARAFDWRAAPLLRLHVAWRSAESFQLTLVEHHAILDGWSVASLLTELLQRVFAHHDGQPLPLSPPAHGYADFVALERTALASPEHRAYWLTKLAGSEGSVLPAAGVAAQRGRAEPRVHQIEIATEVAEQLSQIARTAGVQLKHVLLTAHLKILSGWTAHTDVVTGLVSSGRPETPDGHRILGLFLNTLPLRLDLSPGTWMDLLRQVFEAEREQLPYRRYPLAQIQRLHGGRPVFATAFEFVHFHVYEALRAAKLEVLDARFFQQTNLPLLVTAIKDPLSARLTMTFDYDSSVVPPEQTEAMADAYRHVLAAIAIDPRARHEGCGLLSRVARDRIATRHHHTRRALPQGTSVADLFERQVVKTPAAQAAVGAGASLDYQDLNWRANQLAHHLASLGIGPEARVGIFVERSLELLVALLGVLKAGAAYVPLDTGYPAERIAFMTRDADLSALVTEERLASRLPALTAASIYLDAHAARIAALPTRNPTRRVAPDNLAYLIYTSGSTGKPKGVQISHRALLNFLAAMRDLLEFGGDDVLLALTPVSFDIAALEIFLPLTAGARVVLASPATASDGAALCTALTESQATFVQATPATFYMLLQAGWKPRQGQKIGCGGEALPPELARRLRAFGVRLWNLYGPTETTVWSAAQQVESLEEIGVGEPLSNTQIHVLDAHMDPVPLGVPGEIYIGGAGLARGYARRPDLTATCFVPDPFSATAGTRLYRTGDLGRLRSSGAIEFLGRGDQQVKLRGHRIELGEVEAALGEHPSVLRAVVVAREPMQEQGTSECDDDRLPSMKQLVAYVVPAVGRAPEVPELREHLMQRLPNYMVPAVFVFLAAFPLTPNGKVQRAALPAPERNRPELEQCFVAPRSEAETLLAAIWARVLRLERVGVHDDLYALGADSIAILQVAARAAEAGRQITARDVAEHPSVATLAAAISGRAEARSARSAHVPLAPAQRAFFQRLPSRPDRTARAVVLEVSAEAEATAIERALQVLLDRHDALRLHFVAGTDGWQQIRASAGARLALSTVDLGATCSEEDRRRAVQRAIAAEEELLCLDQPPLLRATYLHAGREWSRLLLVAHELIADAPSWGILLEDFQTAYDQLVGGVPLRLPVETTAFEDWARRCAADEAKAAPSAEVAAWLARDWRSARALRREDRSACEAPDADARVTLALDRERTRAVLESAPSHMRAEAHELALTALAQGLAELARDGPLTVEIQDEDRHLNWRPDVSRTVGQFARCWPGLVDVTGVRGPADALRRVKEQVRIAPQAVDDYAVLRISAQLDILPEVRLYVCVRSWPLTPRREVFAAGADLPWPMPSRPEQIVLDFGFIRIGDALHLTCAYDPAAYSRRTAARLIEQWAAHLDAFAACQGAAAEAALTPSDFPLAGMTQDDLDAVMAAARAGGAAASQRND